MQKLLFFSRVAFICNVCFVIAAFVEYAPFSQEGHIVSTVIVLGVGIALFLNVIVNVLIGIAILQKKRLWDHFPRWLIIINFLFLIFQLFIFIT